MVSKHYPSLPNKFSGGNVMEEDDWVRAISEALNVRDLETAQLLIDAECKELYPDEFDIHIKFPDDPVDDDLFDPSSIIREWEAENEDE